MDPTLLFRIQRRAKPGKPGPSPVAPIVSDIHNGFCAYVASILSKALGPSYSSTCTPRDSSPSAQPPPTTVITATTPSPVANAHLVHLPPTDGLTTTGCWCPNPSKPHPHCWRTCTLFKPQPIVAPEAAVASCPHPTLSTFDFVYNPDEPPSPSTITHLFCFEPLAASASYMRWFLAIQGPPDTPPSEDDTSYLGEWLNGCYYTDDHYRANHSMNPYLPLLDQATGDPAYDPRWKEVPKEDELAQTHFRLCSRFFMELRGDPPKSSRAGCWYDAERVHTILKWETMPVRQTMDAFLPFMLQAKSQRIRGVLGERT